MSPVERQALIDKQVTERNALNAKLTELVKKRDRYVAEQQGKQPKQPADSFDRAVEATLKAQITR
jgi:hypothetical protein